jgi:hypothetical protein
MRLLRATGAASDEFSLLQHKESQRPPYAILSHTWSAEGDEVTFHDVLQGAEKSKAGWAKLRFCADQAQKDDLKDFWVDTCCINKDSEPETTEAINSMFRWYQQSTKCYVFLEDVSYLKRDASGSSSWEEAFRKSRWFTRGCKTMHIGRLTRL